MRKVPAAEKAGQDVPSPMYRTKTTPRSTPRAKGSGISGAPSDSGLRRSPDSAPHDRARPFAGLWMPSPASTMAYAYELHRASLTYTACGLRRSAGGAQRLGARSQPSAAEVFSAASRAPRHHPDRPAFRRRDVEAGRDRSRTQLRRGGRAAARFLKGPQWAEKLPRSLIRVAAGRMTGYSYLTR
jgi:hypothetical protein